MSAIDPTAWVAPSAVVIGDVKLGRGVRILHGAVLPFSPDRHDEIWAVQEGLDFPMTMYGVPRGTSMREIMRRQSAAYSPNDG